MHFDATILQLATNYPQKHVKMMQPTEKTRKNRNRSGKISLMYDKNCIQIRVYYSVKQRQDIINQWHKLYNMKTLTAFIHIIPN